MGEGEVTDAHPLAAIDIGVVRGGAICYPGHRHALCFIRRPGRSENRCRKQDPGASRCVPPSLAPVLVKLCSPSGLGGAASRQRCWAVGEFTRERTCLGLQLLGSKYTNGRRIRCTVCVAGWRAGLGLPPFPSYFILCRRDPSFFSLSSLISGSRPLCSLGGGGGVANKEKKRKEDED